MGFWALGVFHWLRPYYFAHRTENQPLGAFSPTNPVSLPLLIILFWLPVNLAVSVVRDVSWVAVGYLLFGATLHIILTDPLPNHYNPQFIVGLLFLLGTGLAIVSPPLVAWKPEFRLFYLPLYDKLQAGQFHLGETVHANVLAGTLVVVLPCVLLLIWHYFTNHQTWRWLGSGCIAMFILFLLILTQSRAGYLAFALGLGVSLALLFPKVIFGLPIAVVGAVLATYFVSLHPLLEAFSSDGSLGGWDVRGEIWRYSYMASGDFAYTGIGIGSFTTVMPLLYPIRFNIQELPHAHNLFLQVALDLGLPGLIAYSAIIINLFVMLIGTLRSQDILPLHRTLAIGATGSLVGMLIHGLFDAVTWGTKLAFVPWILFALITQLFLYTQAAHKAASRAEDTVFSDT
jgi:putative inorganic carbon (HCO3(-)) transporter